MVLPYVGKRVLKSNVSKRDDFDQDEPAEPTSTSKWTNKIKKFQTQQKTVQKMLDNAMVDIKDIFTLEFVDNEKIRENGHFIYALDQQLGMQQDEQWSNLFMSL